MNTQRENFLDRTRRVIAHRSGFGCAHPECDGRTTTGPANHPDKYENTGEACHIFAASKRGPRGQGNLSKEELRSAANGIWLCAKHSDQVDLNDGKDYPPPVLLSWKAMHEFRVAREHGAMMHPFGWIESLRIVDAPVFMPNQRITFANSNLIIGDTGVGKTAICEWLYTLKNLSLLQRWGAYSDNPHRAYHDVKVEICFRAPANHKLSLELSQGRANISLDSRKIPFSAVSYEVVTIRRNQSSDRVQGDHSALADCLGIHEVDVQALADHINESPGIFLKGAAWKDVELEEHSDERVRQLSCTIPHGSQRPYGALSGGEASAVLLDLAIARAEILSAHRPTLLIIETDQLSLDDSFLSRYLRRLSAPSTPFQSIVVTTHLGNAGKWGGWQVIRLNRSNELGDARQLTKVTIGDVHSQTPPER